MKKSELRIQLRKLGFKIIKGNFVRKKEVKAFLAQADSDEKEVSEYEILDHGVGNAQYFRGAGISYTEFDDIATGTGNSLKEALEDAAEQLAQGGWKLSSDLEQEIEQASDEDEVSKVENESKPDLTYTVTHHSRSMGDYLVKETFDSEEEAITYVNERIKKLEASDLSVDEIKPNVWEVTEGDDATMIPDEVGIIKITDNQDDIDEFEQSLEFSEMHYYASIRVKA